MRVAFETLAREGYGEWRERRRDRAVGRPTRELLLTQKAYDLLECRYAGPWWDCPLDKTLVCPKLVKECYEQLEMPRDATLGDLVEAGGVTAKGLYGIGRQALHSVVRALRKLDAPQDVIDNWSNTASIV